MSQGIAATVGRLGASLCGILIGLNIETHCEATFGLITGLVFGKMTLNSELNTTNYFFYSCRLFQLSFTIQINFISRQKWDTNYRLRNKFTL